MDSALTKFSLPLFISPRRKVNLLKIAQVCSQKHRSEFGLNDIFALSKNNRLNTEIPFKSLMIQQRQMNQQNRKSKKGWFTIVLEYVLTI